MIRKATTPKAWARLSAAGTGEVGVGRGRVGAGEGEGLEQAAAIHGVGVDVGTGAHCASVFTAGGTAVFNALGEVPYNES